MTFQAPDTARFPALAVARAAGRDGPGSSTALIAADEVAVERFLAGSLSFPGITRLVEAAVASFGGTAVASIEELEELDASVREWARVARMGESRPT